MTRRTLLGLAAAPFLPAATARRTSMGLTSDSFQSIRFSSPQNILAADRLMELAAKVGAAGAHGGMTAIDLDWARKTRRMKEELGMYLEIQPSCLAKTLRSSKTLSASRKRREPPACASCACSAAATNWSIAWLRGKQPWKGSTVRSAPPSPSLKSIRCRLESRITRTLS